MNDMQPDGILGMKFVPGVAGFIGGCVALSFVQGLNKRQAFATVLSGPVDSSGLPAFGGSTGSTTVTATGTLIASAANGWGTSGVVDRIGSITNPSWTGLSTNGTMYLYLDIAENGTCTAGSTTVEPSYIDGNAYSVTSGVWSFSKAEMIGKLGNGATAHHVWQNGTWVLGPEPVPESLTPSQFWQQIEADGLTSAADALIDGLPDPLQRIRARRVVEYRRDDAQLIAMATALGMGAEQIDEFFRQACKR